MHNIAVTEMRLAGTITRKSVERFVTTVVNQLTHVAGCYLRMNVACVHRGLLFYRSHVL